ncbi:hypothetical protein Tco_0345555 [Tanacetum coccineum]
MMLLAKAITQHYSTPTNNHFHASLNTSNQVYVHDGRVNVQSKNAGNAGRNTGRIAENLRNPAYGQQANENTPRVRDSNYFKEHMLLAKKNEVGIDLNDE